MKTIKTMENQNQIIISTLCNGKQSLPRHILMWLALGVFAGMALVFIVFIGANLLAG